MKITKPFLRDWGLVFVALVSGTSGFFAFVPGVSMTVSRSILIGTVLLFASGLIAARRTKIRQFPLEEIESIEAKGQCRVECPVTRHLADQAVTLAQASFSDLNTISPDRYDALRLKNPLILACLLDHTGHLAGYFDVLPLQSTFMDGLVRGTVSEIDIQHEDLVAPQYMRSCNRLYLAGIAILDPQRFTSRRHARHLLWALTKYLDHYYGVPSNRHVYALAGTTEGKRLLRRFGFQMVQSGAQRCDAQDLYVASLNNPDLIRSVEVDVGNWSQACLLSWEDPPSVEKRALEAI